MTDFEKLMLVCAIFWVIEFWIAYQIGKMGRH